MALPDNVHKLKDPLVDVLAFNLQLLMDRKSVTATELSRQIHIPRPTINKILYGITEDPRASTLKAIANYFNLTIDELFSATLTQTKKTKIASQAIPIISWENCIEHTKKIESINTTNWHDWVACDAITVGAYALKSRTSMEEQFPKGTTLIIDPSISPQDGDYIIVHYPETKEATLRQLLMDGKETLLLPISQAGKVEKFIQKIKCLGVLVKSIFSYS